MCLALYLFTNDEVEEVSTPETRWGFSLNRATAEDEAEARDWPCEQANVYSVASHLGCGCGWGSNEDEADAADDTLARAEDRAKLVGVRRTLNLAETCLIACWEGNEGADLRGTKEISFLELLNPDFGFEECVLVCVRAE